MKQLGSRTRKRRIRRRMLWAVIMAFGAVCGLLAALAILARMY